MEKPMEQPLAFRQLDDVKVVEFPVNMVACKTYIAGLCWIVVPFYHGII